MLDPGVYRFFKIDGEAKLTAFGRCAIPVARARRATI